MRCSKLPFPFVLLALLIAAVTIGEAALARAELVSMSPAKDNTLYEYDVADVESPFNSNGNGNFFSAGRNRQRSLLRRGLIQFDLSGIPTGAVVVPGTAQLTLEVVDMPKKDESGLDRPFWLMPLDQPWGEGTSTADVGVSGAGGGAAATGNDATWLHTMFDPTIHDPRDPQMTDPGYWTQDGSLGGTPLDPNTLGDPDGTVPAAPFLGSVTFASPGIEADLNAWLAAPTSNYGWIVLGDESVDASNESSNRGFASREHPDFPPTLTFEYTVVPEPSTGVLVLIGLGLLWCRRRR